MSESHGTFPDFRTITEFLRIHGTFTDSGITEGFVKFGNVRSIAEKTRINPCIYITETLQNFHGKFTELAGALKYLFHKS